MKLSEIRKAREICNRTGWLDVGGPPGARAGLDTILDALPALLEALDHIGSADAWEDVRAFLKSRGIEVDE